jgi:hypothetical protein
VRNRPEQLVPVLPGVLRELRERGVELVGLE